MHWQHCNNGTWMLKRDNIAFGALVGLILPCVAYGLLRFISLFINYGSVWSLPFQSDKIMLLALVINLIPIRVYFVRYKFDKTGRGVLLVTFLIMVAFFIIKRYS
jgi:hypothetical protein